MKTIMVICGSGIATSTVISGKIKEWLKEKGLDKEVQVKQSLVSQEVSHVDDYDVVVSTTSVPASIKEKVISGIPLITGIGGEKVFDEIEKKLVD